MTQSPVRSVSCANVFALETKRTGDLFIEISSSTRPHTVYIDPS